MSKLMKGMLLAVLLAVLGVSLSLAHSLPQAAGKSAAAGDTKQAADRVDLNTATLDQLKGEKVLAGYEKWSGQFITTDKFIDMLYNDLSGKSKGELLKHNR